VTSQTPTARRAARPGTTHPDKHHHPDKESSMKTFACGDVIPGCSARFAAADEDGVFAQVAGHAVVDHGVSDVTPELVQAVRDRIVSV